MLADETLSRSCCKRSGPALTPLPARKFDSGAGERALKTHYGVLALEGFGAFTRAEISAAGALVGYLELTQKGKLPALKAPSRAAQRRAFMGIDAATRRNLELTETLSGERAAGSLLAVIDRTVTAAGARELATGCRRRSRMWKRSSARHDAVALFVGDRDLRDGLREAIAALRPISRARWRVCRSARGGPRDLGAVARRHQARRAACASSLPDFDDPLKAPAGEAARGA